MTSRPVHVATVTCLVLGLVAGCTGGSEAGGTPDGSPSTSSTEASTTGPTGPAATTEPTQAASYLPVPAGSTLTPPGTALRFRDSALVAWEPRQDLVGVVGVRVLKVERTTVATSLAAFELPASAEGATPYFVTSEVGNGGTTDLGGRQLPIYVVDSADRLIAPTGVAQDFEPCPGALLPAIFAPGDEARSCLIFLVPQGAELTQVTFRPPEGVVPITWSGKVTKLGDRSGPKEPKPKPKGKPRRGR